MLPDEQADISLSKSYRTHVVMIAVSSLTKTSIVLQIEIRYPTKNLKGEAVKRALAVSLVSPVRQFGDQVRAFRVVWRVDADGLAPAWEAIVARRHQCDQVSE